MLGFSGGGIGFGDIRVVPVIVVQQGGVRALKDQVARLVRTCSSSVFSAHIVTGELLRKVLVKRLHILQPHLAA